MASDGRARLLGAALELFAARGYEATGVQEIVEAAGVTKPALYHHFGNKQGLLQTLLTEKSAAFVANLRNEAAYTGDLPLTLDRVAELYLSFADREPSFYRLQLSLLFTPPESEAHEPAGQLFGAQQALLEQLFRAAARDHGNMRGRHARYAYALLGVLNAYAALIVDKRARRSERMRRELVHQFSHGIYS